MTGLVAVIMIFSIPIIGIVSDHLKHNQKLKANMLKDELELEKMKHENFIVETEKMRLELEKMTLGYTKTKDPVLMEMQKEKVKVL